MPENKETFLARLTPIMSPRAVSLNWLAYREAKHAFRWKKRRQKDGNGNPKRYFEHCRGAALILIDEAHCVLPEMTISAMTHDILEDTDDVTAEDLEYWFGPYGPEVSRIVRLLSKVPKEGYVERLRFYADWKTLMVKACDNLHNLRSLEGTDPSFRLKQAEKSKNHYHPLFDRLAMMTPQEWRPGAEFLVGEIKRQTAIHLAQGRLLGEPAAAQPEKTDGGLVRGCPPHIGSPKPDSDDPPNEKPPDKG